jgi:hypothetical protein
MRDIREGVAGPNFATQPGLSGERASTAIAAGAGGNVRALQTFLRNKGYAISVDGIRGPQTEAAISAYHRGISARAWNTRSQHAGAKPRAQTRPNTRVTTPARVSGGRPIVGGARGLAGSGGGPAPNPVAAAQAAQAAAQLSIEQQADQMIASEFDPQLAEIRRQMAAAQAATDAQVANLGKWYGEVGSTARAAGEQTAQADAGLLAGQDQATQGMLQLFGGPGANGAAGEAGAFADINRAALTQFAAANQSYNANLLPIIQTQGVEAQKGAGAAGAAQIADLAGMLAQVQGARGSARTKYISDLTQQAAENERSQQALDLARALMPSQVAEARANASLATTKARLAPIEAAREARQFGMSVQRFNAELAQTKARTAQIKASLAKDANGGIDWTDPNTRSSLFDQLRPIVQTKNGTWRMHPGAAQKNLNLALRTLGLEGNPDARQLANQLLQQTVTNSHARQMWGQFNYNNGKIVKTGRRFKPKK